MKQLYFFFTLIIISYSLNSQTLEESFGGPHLTSVINSVKYDPHDGGTINVGYVYDSSKTTGRDWLLIKLNKDHNVVWQKTIHNDGEDLINKVTICANGDYIVVGYLTLNFARRGFICRINSSTGNIIWSLATANSSMGESFYDVVETAKKNIAVSGTDNWTEAQVGNSNSFIVLFDSTGKKIWSEISRSGSPDEAIPIGQLPNGNLIVSIAQNVGHYNLVIVELKESNGKKVNENTYSISEPIPPAGLFVNSLIGLQINVKDGDVSLNCSAFQGCCAGPPSLCIYNYNKTSKKLKGNICYHSSNVNTLAFSYTPLGKNDFLITESYSSPTKVFVSRATNNSIVYDDLVKGSVTEIKCLDTTGSGVVYVGSAAVNKHDNTYNLFTTRNNPVTNTSCNITSTHLFQLLPSTLRPTQSDNITFRQRGVFVIPSFAYKSPSYKATTICGSSTSLASENSDLQSGKNIFTIYPNPAVNSIYLNIPVSTKSSMLNIYDVNGKTKLQQVINANVSSQKVDISKLPEGVYNVMLVQEENSSSLKLIKTK